MRYQLDAEFRSLPETEGTLYAAEGGVEIAAGSSAPVRGAGIFLRAGERAQFKTTQKLYARAAGAAALLHIEGGLMLQ